MYQEFFGLKEAPFSIAPNPHYLYMSKQHHEALAHLVYGVGRDGGFVLLTGEVGTGKTTICRCFLEQIPNDTDVAFILNPKLNAEQLLATICDELGISYFNDDISIKELIDSINRYLLKSHSQGRHTVLIIDEAQNLSPEVLEQLRLLTNLETHEKKLLQIVLLGQPELQEMFLRPDLRQLAQRVTARFHLKELQLSELGPYVRHRLGVAGGKDIVNIFPEKTLKKLYGITSGVPRIINLVCDRAMLGAYAQNMRSIDVRTLESAAREILGPSYPSAIKAPPWLQHLTSRAAVASLALFVLAGSIVWASRGIQINIAVSPEPADKKTLEASAEKEKSRAQAGDGVGEIAGKIQRETSNSESSKEEAGEAGSESDRSQTATTDNDQASKLSANSSDESVSPAVKLQNFFSDPKVGDELLAYGDLLKIWNISTPLKSVEQACKVARRNDLQCLDRAGSFGFLRHLGLPAIVTLYAEDGHRAFAVLRKLDDKQATLLINDQEIALTQAEFNRVWRGQFTVIWKSPRGFYSPLQPGTISPLTRWLREGFAVIDQQPVTTNGNAYDAGLVERVKSFQREVGEPDDGVVGEATLILLSRRLNAGMPLLTQEGVP